MAEVSAISNDETTSMNPDEEASNSAPSDSMDYDTEQALLRKKLRNKVISFIVHAHSSIHAAIMRNDDSEMESINVGMQIHKIMITTYKKLWRRAILVASGIVDNPEKSAPHTVNYLGKIYEKDRQSVEKIVLDIANEHGLEFKKFDRPTRDKDYWYGIANTVMDFLHGFELHIREIRMGHLKVQVSRGKSDQIQVPISQYGLKPCHWNLLEGITFSPGQRLRMASSLGPMTALIGLIEEKNERFLKKWVNEVEMACGMIPAVDGMLVQLHDKKPSEIQCIVRYLADICMLTLPRRDNTIFPPPNVFSRIFRQSHHNMENVKFTSQEILDCFDFTGHGAQVFYKIMSDMRWKICGNYDESQAREIVYHATFGTYTRDLSILGKITNETNWHVRDHFNDCFSSPKTIETREIDFVPIKQKFWSITKTTIAFRMNCQQTCVPCFSGYRIQAMDNFLRFLKYPRIGDFTGYAAHFKKYYEELETKYSREGKRQDTGTTKWYKTDVTPRHSGTCEDVNFDASCIFFLP